MSSEVSEDGTDDLIISLPKREQTSEEVEKTHKFADECIELLKHVPDCRLAFNKFIPAYHHHFGHQCRVSDYGFAKLIELFEAIPTTIEITEDADGKRILQLTERRNSRCYLLPQRGRSGTGIVGHTSKTGFQFVRGSVIPELREQR